MLLMLWCWLCWRWRWWCDDDVEYVDDVYDIDVDDVDSLDDIDDDKVVVDNELNVDHVDDVDVVDDADVVDDVDNVVATNITTNLLWPLGKRCGWAEVGTFHRWLGEGGGRQGRGQSKNGRYGESSVVNFSKLIRAYETWEK